MLPRGARSFRSGPTVTARPPRTSGHDALPSRTPSGLLPLCFCLVSLSYASPDVRTCSIPFPFHLPCVRTESGRLLCMSRALTCPHLMFGACHPLPLVYRPLAFVYLPLRLIILVSSCLLLVSCSLYLGQRQDRPGKALDTARRSPDRVWLGLGLTV